MANKSRTESMCARILGKNFRDLHSKIITGDQIENGTLNEKNFMTSLLLKNYGKVQLLSLKHRTSKNAS
jgi:hypothetical protein